MKRIRYRETANRNTRIFLQKQKPVYAAAAFGAKPEDRMRFYNRNSPGR